MKNILISGFIIFSCLVLTGCLVQADDNPMSNSKENDSSSWLAKSDSKQNGKKYGCARCH